MHKHIYKKVEGEYYKFCKCGKRRKQVSIVKERKSLQNKAENLWKKFAHIRDGEVCQVQKFFPELNLQHSGIMQVDHFFPRADKNLFYDTSNATVLCSFCNYLKSNGSRQSTIINMALKEIVLRREGQKKFDEMFETNNRREANIHFNKLYYLEVIVNELQEKIELLNSLPEINHGKQNDAS